MGRQLSGWQLCVVPRIHSGCVYSIQYTFFRITQCIGTRKCRFSIPSQLANCQILLWRIFFFLWHLTFFPEQGRCKREVIFLRFLLAYRLHISKNLLSASASPSALRSPFLDFTRFSHKKARLTAGRPSKISPPYGLNHTEDYAMPYLSMKNLCVYSTPNKPEFILSLPYSIHPNMFRRYKPIFV